MISLIFGRTGFAPHLGVPSENINTPMIYKPFFAESALTWQSFRWGEGRKISRRSTYRRVRMLPLATDADRNDRTALVGEVAMKSETTPFPLA